MPSGEVAPLPTNLLAAIARAIPSIESIPERGQNERHKYAYAREKDVLAAVRGVLAGHGLVLQVADVLPHPGRETFLAEHSKTSSGATMHRFDALVRYRLWHAPTGEYLDIIVPGAGTDTDDKAGPKAMTGALKLCLKQTFLLTFGGDDPEAEPGARRGRAATAPPADAPEVKGDQLTNWPKFLEQDAAGEFLARVPLGAGAGKLFSEISDTELAATGKAARAYGEKHPNKLAGAWIRGAERERDARAAAKRGELPGIK